MQTDPSKCNDLLWVGNEMEAMIGFRCNLDKGHSGLHERTHEVKSGRYWKVVWTDNVVTLKPPPTTKNNG